MDNVDRLDLEQVVENRLPEKRIPKCCIRFLAKILRQNDINKLFAEANGKTGLDFIDVCMDYLDFTCRVTGEENLPTNDGPLIFVSNHPQGGVEAICIAYVLGHKYGGKIKFYANEILSILGPLKSLFLPIYKNKKQSRNTIQIIKDFYKTDDHLILFPAGLTAYKSKGEIIDHPWHKSFIKSAIENKRNIVPLYFEARNSDFFYCIENLRRALHSKIKFDVLLFANEFFRQRGNTFKLYIGEPISWETFDASKTQQEWADWVRDKVYSMRNVAKSPL